MWWPFVAKYTAGPWFDATFMDAALCLAILAERKLSAFLWTLLLVLEQVCKMSPHPLQQLPCRYLYPPFCLLCHFQEKVKPPILSRFQWVLLIKPKPITTLLSKLQMSKYMGCLFIYDSIFPKDSSKKIIVKIKGSSSCKSDIKKIPFIERMQPQNILTGLTLSWYNYLTRLGMTSHLSWPHSSCKLDELDWCSCVRCWPKPADNQTLCDSLQVNATEQNVCRYMLQNSGDVTYLLPQKQEQVANKQLLLKMAALLDGELKVN